MQYYSPLANINGTRIQNPCNNLQNQNLDAYLIDQATQFVQQNGFNKQTVQMKPQVPSIQQPQYVYKNPNIQQFYPEQIQTTPIRQYANQPLNTSPDGIDLYLIKKAEEFVNNLRAQSEVSKFSQNVQQFQLNTQANQQIDNQIQQLMARPVQYYDPQPQIQQREQIQYLPAQFDAPLAQVQSNQLVLPSPPIYQEKSNPFTASQTNQAQPVITKSEAIPEEKLEFIQKCPRGETLYKLVEGGVTYYVKKGLTPETLCNYSLAHLLGVGPPVEIIEPDGLKMEEGVSLREAIKDKMITVDEVKEQIHKLHKTLFDNGMAHCDVKFENCLYFPQYGKVLLIDNGDLAPYGNKRGIKTAGANSTLLISPHGHEERHRVGPGTDLQGFMHIMMNALHGH